MVNRVRSNPKLAVAVAGAVVLVLAWIGWTVAVTSDHGSRAGLGVLLAWPALLTGLVIVSLPFVGGYLLIRRLSGEDGGPAVIAPAEAEKDDEDETEEDSEQEPEPEASKRG